MTKENQRKEKTIIGSLAGIMAVITLVTIFAVVILRQTAARQQKEELAAQAAVQQTVEEQKEQTPQVQTLDEGFFCDGCSGDTFDMGAILLLRSYGF